MEAGSRSPNRTEGAIDCDLTPEEAAALCRQMVRSLSNLKPAQQRPDVLRLSDVARHLNLTLAEASAMLFAIRFEKVRTRKGKLRA